MVPVKVIMETPSPLVLDAGCGFGSDTILFAALGARVLSINLSDEEIAIAQKRAHYYEEILSQRLEITWVQADLNNYLPAGKDFSLTWLASVLAIIRDQEAFLRRVFGATKRKGKIMIVDYNLLHPPFLWNEWLRRRRAMQKSQEFAYQANFWTMVRRRGRKGARFFPLNGDGLFDDAQFFTPGTLKSLLRQVGFQALPPRFTGCAPPFFHEASVPLEHLFSRIPGWNALGRAYLITGIKR